ncbi:hypothetical protein NE237_026575 [Protea cynaroides]|uniref:Uncharacterized protein n=1 Tax=Protea cynaroides TaxID=273540 RepID=A0A9Q0K0M3_9MAGN|nr:hypothetical protein NE237_026575 [Protea cynaroides]
MERPEGASTCRSSSVSIVSSNEDLMIDILSRLPVKGLGFCFSSSEFKVVRQFETSELDTVTPATAPDLPCKTPPDLQSQSLAGLLRLADLSVLPSTRQSPPTPRDSPNPSLTQHLDLQLTIVKGTNSWICTGTDADEKPNCKDGSDCNCLHPIPSPPPSHLQNNQVGAAVVDDEGGTGGKHGENF